MKFLFENASFSFETLRAAGFANHGGADLGEVLVTARAIPDGDETAWHSAWKATAGRVRELGETSLAAGHRVSAREALLRASNYYRTSEFFLREAPAADPEVKALSALARDTFVRAAELLDTPVDRVSIPYEGTTLPGYLFLVDDSGAPRPTIVYNNGYDSTAEESYFVVAAAAIARGYNVLAFDGPGQGMALREQGLVFRADWEAVITPVVDYALTRPEIAPDGISLFGYSLGGYLVARAAAFEHRLAAIILNDGVYDFYGAFDRIMPPFVLDWINEVRDELAVPVLKLVMSASTNARWALNNGKWAFGADSVADVVRKAKAYTLDGVAQKIECPVLVLEAENDQFFQGQAEQVRDALTAPATLVSLTEAEGAGEHCHEGSMARFHQVIFDWLDESRSGAQES